MKLTIKSLMMIDRSDDLLLHADWSISGFLIEPRKGGGAEPKGGVVRGYRSVPRWSDGVMRTSETF